MSVVQIVNVKS